jgi:GntR family transcriptional regulator/MocR family aminotransferase
LLTLILSDYLLQHLDKESKIPYNRQVYQLLRNAILEHVLPVNSKLPSSRELATELDISRNTVLYAYEQLLAEGYVEGRSGSGTFVTDTAPDLVALRRKQATSAADVDTDHGGPTLSQRGQQLVTSAGAAAQQWGAFVPGVPDVTQFPHRIWNRLQSKVWQNPSPSTLTYARGGGHMALREALSDHLKLSRAVDCVPEQVVITAGIHQSIDLCMRLLGDPNDLAWLEDPCYWGTRNLLHASGLSIRAIPVDAEGLCPSAEDFKAVPRFIFLSPSHQYPLGMVMSLARRRLLLEYAKQNNCWIIEDDYDSEFRYSGRTIASLQGLDTSNHVLYMGTFSKTLFPGLRLGYLVLPLALVNSFVVGMEELHRGGNLPVQATLAAFMEQGFFTAHIRHMRTVYANRLALLQEAIASRFTPDQVKPLGTDAGLHLVLQLPRHCDDAAIADRALQMGIAVRPLSKYYNDCNHSEKGLVLGYGCVDDANIKPAFDILADVIQKYL